MQIPGRFCLLVFICAVLELYKMFFKSFLGFLAMDCTSCLKFLSQISGFGCGFLVFGCSSQVFGFLELFLMFGLGIKALQLGWYGKGLMQFLCDFRGKSNILRKRFCLKNGEFGSLTFLMSSNSSTKDDLLVSKEVANSNGDVKAEEVLEEDNEEDEEEECYDEDEEFDVMALRKLVKIERQRANAANAELEKERMASASAAEEAMAMILRLQSEKSSTDMQANQYRRMAEQKQQYDQEVIRSLQWIVMKHESNRSLLEDQFRLCRQKLKLYMKGDEVDEREGIDASMNLLNSSTKDCLDDVFISSLDMDSLML
ncbi:protein FLOURY 1-like [Corylus avellana]|uniref:protein FLOURY 1-like n=1 Tax=Corylus avellana TaxID=13451 RepID=UPI00286A0E15|nr:protein FLOURY 1-like [Corylus avellana]